MLQTHFQQKQRNSVLIHFKNAQIFFMRFLRVAFGNNWIEPVSLNSSCHWWCPHELHTWPISSSALHSHAAQMHTVGLLLSPVLSSSLFSPPPFPFSLWFLFFLTTCLFHRISFAPFLLLWFSSFFSYSTPLLFSLFLFSIFPPSTAYFPFSFISFLLCFSPLFYQDLYSFILLLEIRLCLPYRAS